MFELYVNALPLQKERGEPGSSNTHVLPFFVDDLKLVGLVPPAVHAVRRAAKFHQFFLWPSRAAFHWLA